MDDIVTEQAGSILRVQLNRPTKRNAMTSAMYVALARVFNEAAHDENMQVVRKPPLRGAFPDWARS